jgi:hypothetical protein
MKTPPKLPFIILFDLDGTLIHTDRVTTLSYELRRHLTTTCSPRTKPALCERVGQVLHNHAVHNVRPGMINFIKTLTGRLPHVEMFVFSAADQGWVQSNIEGIEQHFGLRFNRPFFGRDTTDNKYLKSIWTVLPRIVECLSHKYPTIAKQPDSVLNELTVLFDDAPHKNPDRQILVPYTPSLKRFYNIFDGLRDEDFLTKELEVFLERNLDFLSAAHDPSMVLSFVHSYIARGFIDQLNAMHEVDDKCFHRATAVIERLTRRGTFRFDAHTLKTLRSAFQTKCVRGRVLRLTSAPLRTG